MTERGAGDEIARFAALSTSGDYRDRVAAVVGLAQFAEVPAVRKQLQQLVLDPEDTAVTEAGARALMARVDEPGLRVLSAALQEADDNHADWIEAGIADALGESVEIREWALTTAAQFSTVLQEPASDPTRLVAVLRQAGRA
ncbi:hypothetical protein [Nostocoides sp. Soil756]|jgi:hypothetical protein|uniref:hypothetical protein n=1 Tax=Nostocoides sp. Soil756 TaxID=1736399 RepID=UPI0006F84C22|nr:hypothetical protein [Tetrasphaera sp. Soil756]KRE60213.1 hypothetical protein ASG78_16130 [Tetrasphaera sp. Soil756]